MKGNAGKCPFLVSSGQAVSSNVNLCKIKNCDYQNLLGIKFGSKLRFDQHLTDLCTNATGIQKHTHAG